MHEPVKVLLAEDEENIQYLTAIALRHAAFQVTMALTGAEALRLASEVPPPGLLVLDVMLPDLDGFEVCRRLRAANHDVPILFLTAKDALQDRLHGLTIGGDDYLTKPFSVEELVARVKVILRRAGGLTEREVLSCGALSLDDDCHAVSYREASLALSPTEYKLLRFLMRNPGIVLSKSQILDHVWSYDFNGEPGVVETYMWTLRKKLGADGHRVIQTVRGYGYRLDAAAG